MQAPLRSRSSLSLLSLLSLICALAGALSLADVGDAAPDAPVERPSLAGALQIDEGSFTISQLSLHPPLTWKNTGAVRVELVNPGTGLYEELFYLKADPPPDVSYQPPGGNLRNQQVKLSLAYAGPLRGREEYCSEDGQWDYVRVDVLGVDRYPVERPRRERYVHAVPFADGLYSLRQNERREPYDWVDVGRLWVNDGQAVFFVAIVGGERQAWRRAGKAPKRRRVTTEFVRLGPAGALDQVFPDLSRRLVMNLYDVFDCTFHYLEACPEDH